MRVKHNSPLTRLDACVIVERATGVPLKMIFPREMQGQVLRFGSPVEAALFIVGQNLDPSKFYWKRADE